MHRIGFAIAAGAVLLAGAARADLLVEISKSQQRLSVQVDGREAYRWPVSTGRPGFTTPSGKFRPIRLERDWYSHKYDWAPMPWSVFFHGGYAVHGTVERSYLGRPVSHGCVRLSPENAAVLYSLVRREGAENTRIVVQDAALPGPAEPAVAVRTAPELPKIKSERKPQPVISRAPLRSRHRRVTRTAEPVRAHRHGPAVSSHRAAWTDDRRWPGLSHEVVLTASERAWLRSLERKYGIAH